MAFRAQLEPSSTSPLLPTDCSLALQPCGSFPPRGTGGVLAVNVAGVLGLCSSWQLWSTRSPPEASMGTVGAGSAESLAHRASQRGAPGACVCMLGSHSELTSARHRPRVPPQRSPLGEAARPAPTQPLLGWGHLVTETESKDPPTETLKPSSEKSGWHNPISISMYIVAHPGWLRATPRFWKSTQVSWIHSLHQSFSTSHDWPLGPENCILIFF